MIELELLLTEAEVAVVLNALRMGSLIGMPTDHFSNLVASQPDVLVYGVNRLVEKSLAIKESGETVSLNSDLVAIIKLASDATHAAVFVKDIPGHGRHVFAYAASNNAVVEHTQISGGTHHFAVLTSQASLPGRWEQMLPLVEGVFNLQIKIGMESFARAVGFANQGLMQQARDLFQPESNEATLDLLLEDMGHPAYSANISMLWRTLGKIDDARNVMILTGSSSRSWMISQAPSDETVVVIKQSGKAEILVELVELWKAVAKLPSK